MINERCVSKYCYEDPSLIENYELAIVDTKMWHCHHRVAIIMNCTRKELIAKDCYENRPAHDLIFLTEHDHRRLHFDNGCTGFQIGHPLSDETKQKLSVALTGNKNAVGGAASTGYKWFNNGTEEIAAKDCPDGFVPGRLPFSADVRAKMSAAGKGRSPPNKGFPCSEEAKQKIRDKIKGKKKWNNGVRNMYSIECPGDGWVPGFLPRKKRSRK